MAYLNRRVLHIIPTLHRGGAEVTLVKLVNSDPENHMIITIFDPGPLLFELHPQVKVHTLTKVSIFNFIDFF